MVFWRVFILAEVIGLFNSTLGNILPLLSPLLSAWIVYGRRKKISIFPLFKRYQGRKVLEDLFDLGPVTTGYSRPSETQRTRDYSYSRNDSDASYGAVNVSQIVFDPSEFTDYAPSPVVSLDYEAITRSKVASSALGTPGGGLSSSGFGKNAEIGQKGEMLFAQGLTAAGVIKDTKDLPESNTGNGVMSFWSVARPADDNVEAQDPKGRDIDAVIVHSGGVDLIDIKLYKSSPEFIYENDATGQTLLCRKSDGTVVRTYDISESTTMATAQYLISRKFPNLPIRRFVVLAPSPNGSPVIMPGTGWPGSSMNPERTPFMTFEQYLSRAMSFRAPSKKLSGSVFLYFARLVKKEGIKGPIPPSYYTPEPAKKDSIRHSRRHNRLMKQHQPVKSLDEMTEEERDKYITALHKDAEKIRESGRWRY